MSKRFRNTTTLVQNKGIWKYSCTQARLISLRKFSYFLWDMKLFFSGLISLAEIVNITVKFKKDCFNFLSWNSLGNEFKKQQQTSPPSNNKCFSKLLSSVFCIAQDFQNQFSLCKSFSKDAVNYNSEPTLETVTINVQKINCHQI